MIEKANVRKVSISELHGKTRVMKLTEDSLIHLERAAAEVVPVAL